MYVFLGGGGRRGAGEDAPRDSVAICGVRFSMHFEGVFCLSLDHCVRVCWFFFC